MTELTDDLLLEAMATRYGLTLDELRQKLASELLEAEPTEMPEADQPEDSSSPQVKTAGGGPRAVPLVDATDEAENPSPADLLDPALQEDPEAEANARMAREERMRLMPEYKRYYFLEDLPPIDRADPWNQGVYMRFRLNQMRYSKGEQPVDFEESAPPEAAGGVSPATDAPPTSPEGPEAPESAETVSVTPEMPPPVQGGSQPEPAA